ncbi:MAG: CHRD domain-containing protein [Methylococcus sp.]|nr:CHRD domain-containing protein [Methylococcus sp.]
MIKKLAICFLTLGILPLHVTHAASSKVRLKSSLNGAQTIVSTAFPITSTASGTPTIASVSLPVIGLATGALGTADFLISDDRSSIKYTLNVSVMPATSIFMSHIHLGPNGTNGPVIFWLYGYAAAAPSNSPVPPPFPIDNGPFTGEISGVLTAADFVATPSVGMNTLSEAIDNILAGNAYVNIHTVAYPIGEIRGSMNIVK